MIALNLTLVNRNAHNPVITANHETITNADQMNCSLFFLPLIRSIDGILIGIPEIIPAAKGFKLFPTYDIPETTAPDRINVFRYFSNNFREGCFSFAFFIR